MIQKTGSNQNLLAFLKQERLYATTQRLAFAKGKHSTLGSDSHVATLSQDIIEHVFSNTQIGYLSTEETTGVLESCFDQLGDLHYSKSMELVTELLKQGATLPEDALYNVLKFISTKDNLPSSDSSFMVLDQVIDDINKRETPDKITVMAFKVHKESPYCMEQRRYVDKNVSAFVELKINKNNIKKLLKIRFSFIIKLIHFISNFFV